MSPGKISPEWPIVEISSTDDMQQDKNVHMFFYRYCFLSTHKHWPSFRHLPLKFGTKFPLKELCPCKTKSNKGEQSWIGVRSSPFVFCGELTFTSLLLFILLVACAGNAGVQNVNLAVYIFASLQIDVGFSAFYKLKIFCNLHVEKLHVGHIDMAWHGSLHPSPFKLISRHSAPTPNLPPAGITKVGVPPNRFLNQKVDIYE